MAAAAGQNAGVERAFLAADSGQPMTAAARAALDRALEIGWADPGLRAHEGRVSRQLLEVAQSTVAASVDRPGAQVRFLPGTTAALRTALSAVLREARPAGAVAGGSLVATSTVDRLAAVDFDDGPRIAVDGRGRIDLAELAAELQGGAVGAVCLQVGNPEVGTLQPLAAAAALCREAAVPLVVDATMAAGRTALPTEWDALVLDAASWGGGVGVAAVVLAPQWGRQSAAGEGDCLPGIPACAAAALALEAAQGDVDRRSGADHAATTLLRRQMAALPGVEVHGDPVARLPHVVGCSAVYIDAEALLLELDRRGISVASGSACATGGAGEAVGSPSHVLAAMGALTSGNIRVTLPIQYEPQQLERLGAALPGALATLRAEAGL